MLEDYGQYNSPDFNSSTISPQRNRNGIGYITDDQTTNDISRTNVGAYNSTQKIRLGKKSVEQMSPSNHGMSATIHTSAEKEGLPNVRGASKSKRTVH